MDVTPQTAEDIIIGIIENNIESAIRGEPPEKRIVPMIEGAPGVGKTTIVRAAGAAVGRNTGFIEYAAAELGMPEELCRYFTRTYIAAQQEAADVLGLPWAYEGEMIRLRPQVLPHEGICTLFLDEVRKAKTSVINALGQVLLEYRIGEHALAPACTIALASNERTDRAGDIELPSHILDRVTLFRIVVSREQWMDWALANGIHPTVLFFVKATADTYFNKRDEGQLIHPTPRSFERASNIIVSNKFSGEALRAMIEGTVGAAAGHALFSFLSLRDKLPDPDLVLAKPTTVNIPDEKTAQWAMMSAVSGVVKKETMKGLKVFLERFDDEVSGGRELSAMVVQSVFARERRLFMSSAGTEICARYSELVFGDAG